MALTLGTAREKLALFSPASKIDARINQACEALLSTLYPKGALHRVAFTVTDGVFTLPRQYFGCIGIAVGGTPRQIANTWYDVVLNGPGPQDDLITVVDQGDGFVGIRDLEDVNEFGCQLRVFTDSSTDETDTLQILLKGAVRTARVVGSINTGTEVITSSSHGFRTGDVVRAEALDSSAGDDAELPSGLVEDEDYFIRRVDDNTFTLHENAEGAANNTDTIDLSSSGGGKVYLVPREHLDRQVRNSTPGDGEYVDLAVAGNTTTNIFKSLDAVIKPVTTGHVRVYAIDPSDNSEHLVAIYEPGETEPSYRRYRCTNTESQVEALCQMRFVEAVADGDRLPIENIPALRDALLAIHYREEGDDARYDRLMEEAGRVLKHEAKRYHPASTYPSAIQYVVNPKIKSFR